MEEINITRVTMFFSWAVTQSWPEDRLHANVSEKHTVYSSSGQNVGRGPPVDRQFFKQDDNTYIYIALKRLK
jgi:hypothetical protein